MSGIKLRLPRTKLQLNKLRVSEKIALTGQPKDFLREYLRQYAAERPGNVPAGK